MKAKEKENVKVVPFKNYIIVTLFIAVSVILVFYLRSWYRARKEYQLTIPILQGTLSEIRYNELDSYLLENDDTFLYICTASSSSCRDFEVKFKSYINEKQLKDKITYLNISDIQDYDTFRKEFHSKYVVDTDKKIDIYPVLIKFRSSKVVDFVDSSFEDPLTVGDVRKFLDIYDVEDFL